MQRPHAALALTFLICAGTACAQLRSRRGEHPVDLSIRVTWENDRPTRQHFYVQLMTSFGVPVTSGYTDDNGRLGLGQVTGGYYRIHVSGQGIRDQEEQFYVDPNDAYHMETVRVRPSATGETAGPPGAPTVAVTDLNVPKKARKEFEKGNQEGSRKNWKAASEHFQAAIREYPQYAMAYNNLGIVEFQAGDPAGARAAFQKAIDINDHYSQAYVNLGRLLYAQGDNAGAEGLMNKALSTDPRNFDALIVLAGAELRLGEYSLSADNARKVHALQQPGCAAPCPQGDAPAVDHYSVAHFIAGKALDLSHQQGQAEEQFKLYLAETPDGPLAGQARAELNSLEKSGKPQSP
jgi:tetratricopeptide (TPR) repeat protein